MISKLRIVGMKTAISLIPQLPKDLCQPSKKVMSSNSREEDTSRSTSSGVQRTRWSCILFPTANQRTCPRLRVNLTKLKSQVVNLR